MPTAEQLKRVPPAVRPIVEAAIHIVKATAPGAEEIPYRMAQPRSKSMMWKLVRYAVDGELVVGVGPFPGHSAMFFSRGRELDDSSGLLRGGGKDPGFVPLRSPADAEKPAVKRL